MQQLFTQIISQPWALAGMAAASAFLLGLLMPKKGHTNFLAALLFWPVSLLRDLLDAAHTKRLQYYALLLALLGMEAFFSVRAATVYFDVLNTRMSAVEVDLVSIIVGSAVFLCGFLVASHGIKNALGKTDWGNFWIAALVIVHDVAGVVYLNYGPGATGGGDWASISITIGMCAFSLVPFALGNRAEKLRPELEAELEQEVNEFTSAATRTIKRRAVDRVLRLANRTDIIHLVRALPADEFADFKRFVMPVIAPGTPYNLVEVNEQPAIGQQLQLPQATGHHENSQPANSKNNQPANQTQEAPATSNNLNRTPATGQDTTEPDKLDRTVAYLKANPQATDEELAAHLGLSRPASALFWRRKALEMLNTNQPARPQAAPATQSIKLGMVEQRMLEAINGATPEQQAELRRLSATQSLAEFTHTLQQRYPTYAGFINEERVAKVMAYDRQQQAATSSVTGQAESSSPASEPDNITNIASGHRTQRPTGHSQPDSGHQEKPATGHQEKPDNGQRGKAATTQQDTGVRIAAYRSEHQSATQVEVGEALGISERTVRRHWKNEAAS